jgi:HlyD family secretion protein
VRVTATGSIQPTNKVDISSEMSGVIRSVKVDFNSSVKVGDVMAELDRSKLEASVAAARARLAVTLAVVQQAIV